MTNLTALNTITIDTPFTQTTQQRAVKPAASSSNASCLYWANVLNSQTASVNTSEGLAADKTEQTKRPLYWWM